MSKLKVVASAVVASFDAGQLAEGVVQMRSAEAGRALVNAQLRLAKQDKANWVEIRDPIALALEARGLEGGTHRVTLSTIKWCYEQGVELETLTKSRMVDRADKGLTVDLMTGKPKTIKANGSAKAKAKAKAKTEETVKHCGYAMAQAMEQDGFLKFLNVLVYDLLETEMEFGALMDDAKLDFIRHALAECGYMVRDGAEWKVAVIRETENEADA